MRILITGAAGFIGSHLARALSVAGHDVIGCVRAPEKAKNILPGVKLIACDFVSDKDPSVWLPRLEGIDLVINAVGIIGEQGDNTFTALHRDTPIALFEACAKSGIKKVIQISALGADERATSRYHLTKREADNYLSNLNLNWIILQPSIVYGAGGKSTELFSAMSALPVIPLIGDGRQLIQPVFIDDLARLVVKLAESREEQRIKIEAVGPEPVTFKDMLASLRHWLGLGAPVFFNIPVPLVRLGVGMISFLGKGLLNPETLDMLIRGNTGDPAALERITGIKPKVIKDALAASECKPADRQFSRLYFALPVLRISVALLWIVTGIISAFIYPAQKSYELLAQTGITGALAPLALYGAAFLDLVLGLLMLAGYRMRIVGMIQIIVILAYTAIITINMPELWLHPFGPITKNIPLLAAILIIIMAANERTKT